MEGTLPGGGGGGGGGGQWWLLFVIDGSRATPVPPHARNNILNTSKYLIKLPSETFPSKTKNVIANIPDFSIDQTSAPCFRLAPKTIHGHALKSCMYVFPELLRPQQFN